MKWLRKVTRMGQAAPAKVWYRADLEWTTGWYKHRRVLKKILRLQEYDPRQLFWQYLEDLREDATKYSKKRSNSGC